MKTDLSTCALLAVFNFLLAFGTFVQYRSLKEFYAITDCKITKLI